MSVTSVPSREFRLEVPPDEPILTWTRWVQAPPELAFDIWTIPEHMRRWLGPYGSRITACEVDLRVGGSYHWVCTGDGFELSITGEYTEIDRPRKIVSMVVMDGDDGSRVTDVVEFEAMDGGTLIRGTSIHETVESRDAHAASGMDVGYVQSFEKIDAILAELR
jgi:uncharacterized protein YndB with AHSA1/START domain